MFNDINNYKADIALTNVKANPSVYSPNDGAFNSEENMRWLVKKLTTKPFIVGETKADVARQLKTSVGGSNEMSISNGLFSIDGYTFKLADIQNISFDKDEDGIAIKVSTSPLQRFINDLVCYGTDVSKKLESNMENFLCSSYNPKNGAQTWDTLSNNWESAEKNETLIGFIRIVYGGSYADSLTNTGTTIKYGDKGKYVSINSSIDISNFDDGNIINSDYIVNYGISEAFAIVIDQHQYNIYYPIYVKKLDSMHSEFYFDDIYGIHFSQNLLHNKCNTKCYPYTDSFYVDMDNNYPLSSLSFTKCKTTTFPSKIYHFEKLYNSDSSVSRKESYNPTDFITNNFPHPSSLSDFFVIKTISDLLNLIPAEDTTITNIDNTLTYYCLKIDNDLLLKMPGTDVPIPVVFMASNGMLCPNGFIANGGKEVGENQYPLEGFAHFIKRISLGSGASESFINSITAEQLLADPQYDFNVKYNTYLAKPISYYLSLCYSSLMDNSLYISGSQDYMRIKSNGCGTQLSIEKGSVEGVSVNDYDVTYEYEYTGYVKQGNAFISNTETTEMKYFYDITSDKYKISQACMNSGTISQNDLKIVWYELNNGTVNPLNYDDILNYLRRSSVGESSTTGISFNLYSPTGNYTNILCSVPNVPLDSNMLPYCSVYKMDSISADLLSLLRTNNYGTDSLVHSLMFDSKINSWYAYMPQTLSVNKDTLNYLIGKDIDTGYYGGLSLNTRLSKTDTYGELYIQDLSTSTEKSVYGNDIEQNIVQGWAEGNKFDVRRGAFLHVSKIYGDDEKTFEECVRDASIDLEGRVKALENTVNGDGTEENPGLTKIIFGDTDLDINGVLNDIDDLSGRVTRLEKRVDNVETDMLNLTDTAGLIGISAMYLIKRFGITNITGTGATFDFSNIYTNNISPLQANNLVKYVYIGKNITKLGNKLFYNCADMVSINSGTASMVKKKANQDAPLDIVDGNAQLECMNITPNTFKLFLNDDIYTDDGKGVILLNYAPSGTIDYVKGTIQLNDTAIQSNYAIASYYYYEIEFDGESNTIPKSVTTLGSQVFAQNINDGYEPKGIKEINLMNLANSSSVSVIGSACFWGSALESIIVPTGVTSVGNYVFAHSQNLKSLKYHGLALGNFMFSWCRSLEDIEIGTNCASFGRKCFTYCNNVENDTINYLGTAEQWYQISKGDDWAGKSGYLLDPRDDDVPSLIVSESNINSISCSGNSIFNYDEDLYSESNQYKLTQYNGNQPSSGKAFAFDTSQNVFRECELSIDLQTAPINISVGSSIYENSILMAYYNSGNIINNVNYYFTFNEEIKDGDTKIAEVSYDSSTNTLTIEGISQGIGFLSLSLMVDGYYATPITVSVTVT